MREREMRQRIERFLQTRLRRMLAPATLGLGLAMTGCPSSGLDATDDGGAAISRDAQADQGAVMKYLAPIPDAGQEKATPAPAYMAPMPDSGAVALYSAALPDAGPDNRPAMRYMAQAPDASPDEREIIALYMAQLPRS